MAEECKYDRIENSEDHDDVYNERIPRTREPYLVVLPWLLFAMVTVAYISHWRFSWSKECPECFNDRLLDAPIEWIEKTYVSDLDGFEPDIYSKRHPDHKKAWLAVQDIGVTVISEEEAARLPGHRPTAKVFGNEQKGYAVYLEVFHQLHCLKALRAGFYGDWSELNQYKDPEFHADHCFSYLIQTLLCHADVGVMPTFWMDWSQDYKAYFNITRQCRNFDTIKQWAQGRKAVCDTPGKVKLNGLVQAGLIAPGSGKCR